MQPVLYQLNGELLDGRYLPGQYAWPVPMTLASAEVLLPAPLATGTLQLALEVGGLLTGDVLVMAAGTSPLVSLALAVAVPAQTPVRWRASFSGSPAQCPTGVQLLLTAAPTPALVKPPLRVNWVYGKERLPLYAYDPTTYQFTDISNGLAVGRCTLDQSLGFRLALQGVSQLQIGGAGAAGVVIAPQFSVGLPLAKEPRVEFSVGGNVVMYVSPAGVYVADLTEGTLPALPAAPDPDYWRQFVFWDGGQAIAVLNWLTGLTVNSLIEMALP